MVNIHRIACGNVNCCIVMDNGSAILIDTGRKKYREKILKMCREFHVSLIVLTHGHMDHCQNAAYLAHALQIPIAMCEKDRELIPDNRKQSLSEMGKVDRWWNGSFVRSRAFGKCPRLHVYQSSKVLF